MTPQAHRPTRPGARRTRPCRARSASGLVPALRFPGLLVPAFLVASLFVASCGGRTPWGSWDAGPGADAAPPPDATPPRDAGPFPDAGLCQENEWWELVATPLYEVSVLSPHGWMTEGLAEGISVRFRVQVAVGGCDRLASVQVTVDSDNLQVQLRSHVWRYHGPSLCPSDLRLEPEYWALADLAPGEWTLWDAFSMDGPGALASFRVRECMDGEDCQCYLWDGEPGTHGADCQFDCQCAWPLACVFEGQIDPQWGGVCAETCSTDSDCPLPMRCVFDTLDVPEGYCAMERDPCTSDAPCPEGHSCLPGPYDNDRNYCQPAMEVVWEPVRCEEDCDCPWGYACLAMTDTMTRACQIPCRGNGDCPEYLMCDDQGYYWQNLQVCTGFWD